MNKFARLPALDRASGASLRRRRHPHSRYFAFLSYSHKDEQLAEWLHSQLEQFRVPGNLAGKLTENGVIPKRLTPIFRDQHELAAADDLGEEIREALANCQFLIVLCSPDAARSGWTNAEIETFKRTRPDGCVLAAIASGEPFASEIAGREAEECFPPALRHKYDRRGRPTGKRAEPLAADLRQPGEARRLGVMKLIAGMLGVGLDDLVQREATRRQRRLALLAAASVAGMAVTSTLAITAIQARDEARQQRQQAEGLVQFMLGDLKDKLEPLGRLDVLDSVGTKALAYYQKQDTSQLSDDSLAQRSKALTLLGQVASTRGDLDEALRFYSAAFAGTAEALRRSPDDPERLYEHGQNVFYLADIAHTRGNLTRAEALLQEYKRLSRREIELDPSNAKWQMEGIYADTDLGVILNDEGRYEEAAAVFENARADRQRLAAADPSNAEYKKALVEGLGWLSTAREREGRLADALAARQEQVAFLTPLIADPHADADYQVQAIGAYRAAGRISAEQGDIAASVQAFQRSIDLAARMAALEPANTQTQAWSAWAKFGLARVKLVAGGVNEASALVRNACDTTDRLIAKDSTVVEWRLDLRSSCLEMLARVALADGDLAGARQQADNLVKTADDEWGRTHSSDARIARANALLVEGLVLRAAGKSADSVTAFRQAAASWPAGVPDRVQYLAQKAIIFKGTGRADDAASLEQRLASMGFKDPIYLRDAKSVG